METVNKEDKRIREILDKVSSVQGITELEGITGQHRGTWYDWANGRHVPRSKSLRIFERGLVAFWKKYHREQGKLEKELAKLEEIC